jgi:hypothetical protein
MSQYRIWKGLTRMLATDWQEAAKINVLLCFMPIPYGSHGYLFALSDVPFFQFVGVFALVRAPVMGQAAKKHQFSLVSSRHRRLIIFFLVQRD